MNAIRNVFYESFERRNWNCGNRVWICPEGKCQGQVKLGQVLKIRHFLVRHAYLIQFIFLLGFQKYSLKRFECRLVHRYGNLVSVSCVETAELAVGGLVWRFTSWLWVFRSMYMDISRVRYFWTIHYSKSLPQIILKQTASVVIFSSQCCYSLGPNNLAAAS